MSWSGRRRRSRGRWVLGGMGLAAGAAAAAAYPARRAELGARAQRALRGVGDVVTSGVRDLGHRAQGLAHHARAWLTPEHPTDEVLAERVRARLGHLTSHARAIRIEAHQGRVTLAGPVLRAERMQVLRGVRAVRGVHALADALEPHDGADIPALQGSGPRAQPAMTLPPGSPAYRLVAGVAGVFLVGRAVVARGLGRIPAGLFGAALIRTVVGDANAARRDAARLARELREAAARAAGGLERARGAAGREGGEPADAAGDGGGAEERGEGGVTARPPVRRVPQVKEVKSPAELEPGVASASPDPLRPGRVDRRDLRGRPSSRRAPGADAGDEADPDEQFAPHSRFNAPDPGSPVREADLGASLPPDEDVRAPAPDDVPWGPSPDEVFPRRGSGAGAEPPPDRSDPHRGGR